MKKQTRAKKQHYISQHYLKNFCTKNFKIYVYDKEQKKFYWKDVSDVGEENQFFNLGVVEIYNTSDGKTKKQIDASCIKDGFKPIKDMSDEEKNDLEHSFDDLYSDNYEPKFSLLIDNVIAKAISGQRILMSPNEKEKFSYLFALHYIRTKFFRDNSNAMRISIIKKITAMMAQYKGHPIKESDLDVKYTKEQIRLLHIDLILNGDLVDSLANIFYNYNWEFVYFDRGTLFLTDKLLTLCPTEPMLPMFPQSFASYGMIVEVPLSSRLLLVMSDKRKFESKKDLVCVNFNILSDYGLKAANRNSVACSYKYVFSRDSKKLEEAVKDFEKEIENRINLTH